MKLLRCYVENYGKLQQFEYEFDDKLNIILQQNGWGKSTFASFIKAMLFGLPVTKKTDLDENERAKYTPWQKGAFGGWLEFEIKGKNYRIERFFGEKASKDKTTIYDLTTNTTIPDEDFVQKSLGINADTFMRSTFIQHGLVSNADSESIRERLGKLIENQEFESIADVDARLLEKQTEIEHLRGKGGKLNKLKVDLDTTLDDIEKCKEARATADNLSIEYKDNVNKIKILNDNIAILRESLQAYNDEQVQNEKVKRYQSMQADFEKLQAEKQALLDFFKGTPPDNRTMERLLEMQSNISAFQSKLDEINSNSISQNVYKLENYFAAGVPTQDEMDKIKEISHKLDDLQNNMRLTQNIYNQTHGSPQKNIRKYIGFGAFGAALICLIIGLAVFLSNIPLLITFIVIAVILGGLGVFLISKPAKSSDLPAKITTATNLEKSKDEYEKLKNIITNFVQKYHENPQNYKEAIFNIDVNRKRLIEYKSDLDNTRDRKEELQKRSKEYKAKLTEYYLNYFPVVNNFTNCYNEMQAKISQLKNLESFCKQKEAELRDFAREINFNGEITTIQNINADDIQKQIATFERQKDEITHQNSIINSQLINAANKASSLGSLEATAQDLRENIENLSEKLNIIQLTRKFLNSAKDSLTSRYLTPLASSFREYSRKLVGDYFDKVSIDTSLNVLIEQQGEKKASKFYSSGGRDIIELCMRLALAKTLFNDETPPLIMDDPFNNLDDDKTEKALEMLEEIANDFQVIYLVCHSSRAERK